MLITVFSLGSGVPKRIIGELLAYAGLVLEGTIVAGTSVVVVVTVLIGSIN